MSGLALLSRGNPKLVKGEKKGYMSFILHLAPASLSGFNTCAMATEGCKKACLNTAGRGGMFKAGENTNMIQQARIRKTKWFFEDRKAFIAQLIKDIKLAIKQAEKANMIPCIRLNGTSDIRWELHGIINQFPDVQFYDYTKIANRRVDHLKNYHLTFSKADGNDAEVDKAIAKGMNIAVVFEKELPEFYKGVRVVNGDETDLRFLDEKGVIVGLKAKGKAKKDQSGFVVRAA